MLPLRELDISDNRLRDLGHLRKLVNLEELNFNDNEIANLEFVRGLQKLRVINGNRNQIEDLTPLLDLPELARASFFFNPFDDNAAAVKDSLDARGVRVLGL